MAVARMDRFGRVVIPKSIRDALGFAAGTELRVRKKGKEIVLVPTGHSPLLKRKGHVLVFAGGEATGDITDIIEKVREERIRQTLGLDDS